VNYEDALTLFKDGDFHTAVPLLERVARETGYSSDVINHTYTLALYRIGDNQRLAEVAFRVGTSLVERDPASAMDYFQRAMFAGLEAQRVRQIGKFFEAWASQSQRTTRSSSDGTVNRVAHLVGSLSPGQVSARYLKMLVASLRKQGIDSTIYTTESAASWFFNAASTPQSQPTDIDAEVKIASVEGDFLERASRIAETLRASGIAVAFFHAGLAEQITARVAAMRPVAVQVHVDHGGEMDADLFDGYIHFFQNGMKRRRFSGHADWIPPVSDIQLRLAASQPVTRKEVGLESADSISATFGDLHKFAGNGYLVALSEILNRFPNHFHLFAGAGNVKAIRSRLHSEGVLPRVRFLGHVGDVAPLLDLIDVYLAPFPHSGVYSILEAMGAGKPVVSFRFPADSNYNSGAELVGIRELAATGEGEYITIADRLLRNPELRARHGQAMLNRFRTEFRPDRLGERYKAFLESLCTAPARSE
jgi:glycosyltransferase involved in cell wall biosynthesis